MEALRRELGNRPLLLSAVALCIGLTIPLHPLNVLFLVPLFLAQRPAPVAIALAVGLFLTPKMAAQISSPYRLDGKVIVIDVPQRIRSGVMATVEMEGKKLCVVFPSGSVVVRGDEWHVRGKAVPVNESMNYLADKGIEGEIKVTESTKLADGPWPWQIASGWQRSFESFARSNLTRVQAQWLEAFAFRVNGMESEETDALKTTGTIHLIAASGIHVAALGALCLWIGTFLGCPRGITLGIAFAILTLYAMATGLHLPTVRAVIAFIVAASAYMVRRGPDGLSALALAVLVYLPFAPNQVYEIGFQLSVTVVGFLILWPRRQSHEPAKTAVAYFRHHLWEVFAVSLIAALAAEPILAFSNGDLSLLTVPANLLAVPIVMAAILLGFLLHVFHLGWALPLVGGLVSAARELILWGSQFTGVVIPISPFSAYWLTPFYGTWIWFWRPRAQPCD